MSCARYLLHAAYSTSLYCRIDARRIITSEATLACSVCVEEKLGAAAFSYNSRLELLETVCAWRECTRACLRRLQQLCTSAQPTFGQLRTSHCFNTSAHYQCEEDQICNASWHFRHLSRGPPSHGLVQYWANVLDWMVPAAA